MNQCTSKSEGDGANKRTGGGEHKQKKRSLVFEQGELFNHVQLIAQACCEPDKNITLENVAKDLSSNMAIVSYETAVTWETHSVLSRSLTRKD